MAYEMMYEGDGFIRKGPEPKVTGSEERITAGDKAPSQPAKKERRGGITMFRFTRLVFGR